MDSNMELRAAAADWSLAGDRQLLHLITALHQKILAKSEETSNKLQQMASALDNASVSLQNVNNRFQSLSNSQFIESRVYEDEIDATHRTDAQLPPAEAEPANRDPSTLLQHSLARLEHYHEPVRILPDSDSDTDSGSDSGGRMESVVLRARELYAARPLPHIIGSAQWKAKWHAGLVAEDSDSESEGSAPRAPLPPPDDFSSEERDSDTGAISPHGQESFSSEELPEPEETHQPLSQSELAAELARRLGGVAQPLDTDRDEREPAAPRAAPPPAFTAADTMFRPQRLMHDRLTGTVFCDEPPALDAQYEDEPEQPGDDIFADLDDAPVYRHDTKKPTGAVSLFSEEIGAAIRKHNTERSKDSPPVHNKNTVPTKTSNKNIREERQLPMEEEIDAFADLFAAADVPVNKPQIDIHKDDLFDDIDDLFSTDIVTKVPIKETSKNVKGLFDDDDDLFSDIQIDKGKLHKDTQAKESLFDDDLFAEGRAAKQTVKVTGRSEDIKSVKKDSQVRAGLFEDDDDLFAEKQQNVKVTVRSEDIKSVPKDSHAKAGLFDDDDDDLFAEGHGVKIIGRSEDKKSVHKDSQVKGDIFDDDLFLDSGIDRAIEPAKEINISKVADTNETLNKKDINVERDIFAHDEDTFKNKDSRQEVIKEVPKVNNTVDPLFEDDESNYDLFINTSRGKPPSIMSRNINNSDTVSDNKKSMGLEYKLRTAENIKQTSPLLFDDDDMDTLFSVNTQKIKTENNQSSDLVKKQSTQSNIDSVLASEDIYGNRSNEDNEIFTKEVKDNLNETFKDDRKNLLKSDEFTKDDSNKSTVNKEVVTEDFESEILNEPNASSLIEKNPGKTSEVIIEKSNVSNPIVDQKPIHTDVQVTTADESAKDMENDIFFETPPFLPQKSVDTFHDIFIDQPPEFQRTTEPKKSKNINALFDDDSDDEALFFKKNDVLEEKIEMLPDNQHEKPVFGLFYDEPPDLDFDFEQKNETVSNSEVTTVSSQLTSEQSQPQDVSHDARRITAYDSSKQHAAAYQDDVLDNVTATEAKTPSPKLLAKDETSPKLENKPAAQFSEESKKVGKLKSLNININVNTLLPGASPKKTSNKDIETIQQNIVEQVDSIESKIQEESDSLLCNKLSKERPKIQVKRRPSSRRARKEAVRRSAIEVDEYDSAEVSQSVEESRSRQEVKINTLGKVYAKPMSDDEELFGKTQIETKIPQQSDSNKTSQNDDIVNKDLFQSPMGDDGRVSDDEELFGKAQIETKDPQQTDSNKTSQNDVNKDLFLSPKDDGRDVQKREHNQKDTAKDEVDLFKSLPIASIGGNEIDDDDIFRTSRKSMEKRNDSTKKVMLFDDNSDDDLFGAKKVNDPISPQEKTKSKTKLTPVVATKSLFGDDTGEDLFGTEIETASGPSLVQSKEKTKMNTKSSKDPSNTELVFDDPLSAFGQR